MRHCLAHCKYNQASKHTYLYTTLLLTIHDLERIDFKDTIYKLGIISHRQKKFTLSMTCFQCVLHCPPEPLHLADLQFQIGYTLEKQHQVCAWTHLSLPVQLTVT